MTALVAHQFRNEQLLFWRRFVTGRKRGHRDRLDGFGPFRDLRRLVMFEVAR